jgi:hypothetical protein
VASDLLVVAPRLTSPTAGDLVDAITRRIVDVPAARKLVSRRPDDELLCEVLDPEVAWEDRKAFARELGVVKRELRAEGVPPQVPLGAYSRDIAGESRRTRRPDQTDRSMSLSDEFTVWLPAYAEGFGVEPHPYLTRDLIPAVAKDAAGSQVWADVPLEKLAGGLRAWATRRQGSLESLQVVAVAALAEITSGFVYSIDAYWGPLVPAPPDEFVRRYQQTPPH